jgi:hypothetical protein
MKYIRGRVIKDAGLKDIPKEERKEVYNAVIEALASVHACDPIEIGLKSYGKLGLGVVNTINHVCIKLTTGGGNMAGPIRGRQPSRLWAREPIICSADQFGKIRTDHMFFRFLSEPIMNIFFSNRNPNRTDHIFLI